MVRFWPTAGIVCLLAGFLGLVALGLWSAAHRELVDLQGQWLGPLPLDGANDCRIRLYPTDNFDIECRGQTKYAAQGTWRRYENKLELTFAWFVRDNQKQKPPTPWVLNIEGQKNALTLTPTDQKAPAYQWQRATP